MIKGLLRRVTGWSPSGGPSSGTTEASIDDLRAQVMRLEDQNDRLRKAMRHCTDCEYRIESISRRDAAGVNADGGAPHADSAP